VEAGFSAKRATFASATPAQKESRLLLCRPRRDGTTEAESCSGSLIDDVYRLSIPAARTAHRAARDQDIVLKPGQLVRLAALTTDLCLAAPMGRNNLRMLAVRTQQIHWH